MFTWNDTYRLASTTKLNVNLECFSFFRCLSDKFLIMKGFEKHFRIKSSDIKT